MNIELQQHILPGLTNFDGTANQGLFQFADQDQLPMSSCIGLYVSYTANGRFIGETEVYAVPRGVDAASSLTRLHLFLNPNAAGPFTYPRFGTVSPVIRLPRDLQTMQWYDIAVITRNKLSEGSVTCAAWFDVGDPFNA